MYVVSSLSLVLCGSAPLRGCTVPSSQREERLRRDKKVLKEKRLKPNKTTKKKCGFKKKFSMISSYRFNPTERRRKIVCHGSVDARNADLAYKVEMCCVLIH